MIDITFFLKYNLEMYIQTMYISNMKYDWNPKKNDWLKEERGISFEKIIFHLSQGDIWKTANHSDQTKYLGQKIYFVVIDEYIYMVPHIIEKEYIYLKTIIPSRKSTRII